MPHAFPLSGARLQRAWACVGWALLATTVLQALRAGAAFADGHLFSTEKVIGFVADPSVYTNFIFGWLIFTFYLWLPHGIAAVFRGLRDNEVLTDPLGRCGAAGADGAGDADDAAADGEAGACDWVAAIIARFDRRRVFLGALAAFVIVLVAMGLKYRAMPAGIWYTAGPAAIVAAQVWAALLMFCIVSVLLACWMMIVCLRDVFRGGANVRPLHPDGVGGLAPLAEFALGLVYLISVVGVMLCAVTPYTRSLAAGSVLSYTVSVDIVVAAILYAIASPLVFFQVLATASKAMNAAKTDWLARIAARWDAEYPDSVHLLESPDDPAPAIERLKAIRELHDATRAFPVWPFDQANIRKFVGSYLAPIVMGVLIEFVVGVLSR
ncbi:hypothetical protein KDM41_04145 [bacterium]|nr:hypothetical protein [bacterium]